jgi:hypothetical protein
VAKKEGKKNERKERKEKKAFFFFSFSFTKDEEVKFRPTIEEKCFPLLKVK